MYKINVTNVNGLVGQKVISQDGTLGIIYCVRDDDHFPINVKFADDDTLRSYTYQGYEYRGTKERYITFEPDSSKTVISEDIKTFLEKHNISSEELISILLQEYQ